MPMSFGTDGSSASVRMDPVEQVFKALPAGGSGWLSCISSPRKESQSMSEG